MLLEPTKYEEWMIETANRNDITSKYHLLAKVLPGRGKTTGLALHVLQRLKLKEHERPEDSLYRNDPYLSDGSGRTSGVRAVIICATREAAYVTKSAFDELSRYLDCRCEQIVGGGSLKLNVRKAQEGLDIVICTIGKLVGMVSIDRQGKFLENAEILCFDDTKVLLQTSDDQTRAHVDQVIKLREYLHFVF